MPFIRAAVSALALAGVLVIAPSATAQDASSVTIQHLLSVPFPSQLVADPAGGMYAWVADSAGQQNIYLAEAPEELPIPLTAYAGDSGQEISELTWLPNSGGFAYVRGGAPNAANEVPNPALAPGGIEQAIWVFPIPGGVPKKLGQGAHLAVAPAQGAAAGRIAFVHDNQIWWAPTDGMSAAEQLLHTRGRLTHLRWSPTGMALAFVSGRGDHAFVGVYDVAHRSLRYLAPNVDRDRDPVWSPDGRRVAFLREPAETRTAMFRPRRTGQPWSVWVADATTGTGRAIWTAVAGDGSVFRGLDAPDNLLWTAKDRIVFPWEGTGWMRLYAIPSDSGAVTPLTPGPSDFEVEFAALTFDRRTVLLTSNQGEGDRERRHIWRVDMSGTAPGSAQAVTTGKGIEWTPVAMPDASEIVCLHSDARTPAHPVVVVDRGTRDLWPVPPGYPSAALVEPRDVSYRSPDGLLIHAQLFVPAHLAAGERRPAIVFFHGGSQRQMLLGFHYMAYYHNAYAMNQYLASRGYLVLAINYRSGTGYGLGFREAPRYGAAGGSEYVDVLGAAQYLRGRSDVDPARIGAWGGSYGGYLTALALARNSDWFAAGVDLSGVHDWNLETPALVPGWDTEKDLAARRIAYVSSPLASVDRWRSPVLLIQGDDDHDVAFAQTVQLTEDLRARGVHVETIVYADEGHDLLLHAHWVGSLQAAADFFDRTLGRKR